MRHKSHQLVDDRPINSLLHNSLPTPPVQIIVCDHIVPDIRPDLGDVDHDGKESPLLENKDVSLGWDLWKCNPHCMTSCQEGKSNGLGSQQGNFGGSSDWFAEIR